MPFKKGAGLQCPAAARASADSSKDGSCCSSRSVMLRPSRNEATGVRRIPSFLKCVICGEGVKELGTFCISTGK